MTPSRSFLTMVLVLCTYSASFRDISGFSGNERHGAKRGKKHCRPVASENFTEDTGCRKFTVDQTVDILPDENIQNISNTVVRRSDASAAAALGIKSGSVQKSGVYLGFLPDTGKEGGTLETIGEINEAIGGKSATYGWYAQVQSGTPFDGNQFLWQLEDVKSCNCVFQPAVMPLGGWKGLTKSDNSQAVAIAKVLKQFTDEGIPVWLRFAHEANWYQTDGTYAGNVKDFQAGWAAVAAACKKIAPAVKMWWSPNVATPASYAQYAPHDMSTVHLVGVDYYPKALKTGSEFLTKMKSFHDTYAVDGRLFAIGETGLGYAASLSDRQAWLKQVMSAKSEMKNYVAATWFNYQKEFDYRIVIPNQSNAVLKRFLA